MGLGSSDVGILVVYALRSESWINIESRLMSPVSQRNWLACAGSESNITQFNPIGPFFHHSQNIQWLSEVWCRWQAKEIGLPALQINLTL